MTKNIKLFLIVILVSLPFWFGMNILEKNLEDFFWLKQIEKNPPSFFIAQISQNYILRTKVKVVEDFEITAESVISVEIDDEGNERVLFSKEEVKKMPMASITKLMTAVVASEFYRPTLRIQISKEAVKQPEENGNLKLGEILQVEDLLYIMLIESSNDAAFALGEVIGIDGFTDLMNLKARDMGLQDTEFFNLTGLDPKNPNQSVNYSTARDLVKLAKYLLTEEPEILEILSKKEYELYLENGVFHHTLQNTNELLGEIPGIVGGKTGFTERASGCLLLIMRGSEPGNYLVNVILNSPHRFEEMRKLIEFTR